MSKDRSQVGVSCYAVACETRGECWLNLREGDSGLYDMFVLPMTGEALADHGTLYSTQMTAEAVFRQCNIWGIEFDPEESEIDAPTKWGNMKRLTDPDGSPSVSVVRGKHVMTGKLYHRLLDVNVTIKGSPSPTPKAAQFQFIAALKVKFPGLFYSFPLGSDPKITSALAQAKSKSESTEELPY